MEVFQSEMVKNIFATVIIADFLQENSGSRFRFGVVFRFFDAETEPLRFFTNYVKGWRFTLHHLIQRARRCLPEPHCYVFEFQFLRGA
jgi:hypothetical protein